jgi:hypothetical protein
VRNAEILEWGREVVRDQKSWLDKAMYRLLPERFHYQVRQGHVSSRQIQDWLRENGVQVTFFRNVPMIRITVKGVLFDEWKLQLEVDGRPVDMGKLADPKYTGDDVFVDGEGPKPGNN